MCIDKCYATLVAQPVQISSRDSSKGSSRDRQLKHPEPLTCFWAPIREPLQNSVI